MDKRAVIWLLLVFSVLIISGCGDKEKVTGGVIGINDVSTLTITVKAENGSMLYGAEVYVNKEYKGETSQYGESQGTKTVVLEGKNNEIVVKKKGYTSATAIVNAASSGEQSLTLVLEKIKGAYKITVLDEKGALEEARVSLYRGKNSSSLFQSDLSDSDGIVLFKKVEQGNYTLKVSKPEYQQFIVEEELEISDEYDLIEREVTLVKVPELLVKVQEQGNPLPQAEVSIYQKEEYHAPNGYPLDTQFTNKEGIVLFKRLEHQQEYVIVAKREGYHSETLQLLLTPENSQVTLELSILE